MASRVVVLAALAAVAAWASAIRPVDGLYSSFYSPLYDPRILGYRVEARFPPEGGRAAREPYRRLYGYRGERLVDALGRGGFLAGGSDHKMYDDVNVYYTYSNS